MSNTASAAHQRVASLLDEQSFVEIGSRVVTRLADTACAGELPGDGVVTGSGTIGGALVYVYAQDEAAFDGAIGEMHARKICRIYDLAKAVGAPVIALLSSAGVRLAEGSDSLQAFGAIYKKQAELSGVIPQITAVFGTCGGGLAVSASMADFVLMEETSGKLFLSSPNAILGNYEEKCDTASAAYQTKETGLCDFAGSADEVYAKIRELISILPQNNETDLSEDVCEDDLNRSVAGIDAGKTAAEALAMISDGGKIVECKAAYAPEMTTALIRLNGRTIGAVANAAPLLTAAGAEKAARFLSFCDAFSIPVLTLAQAEGFSRDEKDERALPRALGKLAAAYASATVPEVTVVCGKDYGTASVVMGAGSLGADLVYAWDSADMGLLNPEEAVKLLHADEISGADDPKQKLSALTAAYRKLQSSAEANARRGYVDDIIRPEETRQRLAAAFEMLYTKSTQEVQRKHSTI